MGEWVTVTDRIKELGVQAGRKFSWEIGAEVRNLWSDETGSLPPKSLRKKSRGGGTHCFAIYPPEWISVIDRVILRKAAADERQKRLF
tara:strand:- start:16 stop:279 length:264 start_codon:yes stop_codon:yes gene_type:complete